MKPWSHLRRIRRELHHWSAAKNRLCHWCPVATREESSPVEKYLCQFQLLQAAFTRILQSLRCKLRRSQLRDLCIACTCDLASRDQTDLVNVEISRSFMTMAIAVGDRRRRRHWVLLLAARESISNHHAPRSWSDDDLGRMIIAGCHDTYSEHRASFPQPEQSALLARSLPLGQPAACSDPNRYIELFALYISLFSSKLQIKQQ